MSSKRSRPYDDPPSPESSEEEEEEEEEEQTPIQNPKKSQSDEEEEEEEEEEEVEEEEEEVEEEEEEKEEEEETDADLIKKPTNNNTKVSQSKPESESGPEAESESESEAETNYIAKPTVKESPSSKVKNVAKTTSVVEEKLKKAAKAVKPSPKQQVSSGGGEDDEDGGEKKPLFVRVWSYEDEVAVLQGMIDFKKGNGKDPLSNSNSDEFYKFVKQKLSNGKFTKAQVVEKAKRLKKKYMTNVAKSNKGKAVEFSNPHDLKAYKLSGIIWADNDGDTAANVSYKVKSSSSNAKSGNSVATIGVVALPASDNENVGCVVKGGGGRSAKKPKISEVSHAMEVDEVKKEKAGKVEGEGSGREKDFAELYPHLMESFEGERVPKVPALDGLKSCLGMVDGAVLEEWNRKWKDVRVAEMDFYLRRIALIQEQANWFANAVKSSKS